MKNHNVPWVFTFYECQRTYSVNHKGVLYERGHGVPIDNKKAIEYYIQAANQGDIKAQHIMGIFPVTHQ